MGKGSGEMGVGRGNEDVDCGDVGQAILARTRERVGHACGEGRHPCGMDDDTAIQ